MDSPGILEGQTMPPPQRGQFSPGPHPELHHPGDSGLTGVPAFVSFCGRSRSGFCERVAAVPRRSVAMEGLMSFLASLTDEPALLFEFDATADRWSCSAGLCELYGIPPGQDPTTPLMLERVVAEDRHVVLQRFEEVLSRARPFSLEYRLVAPDGRTRRLVLVGESEDAGGEVKRVSGFIVDITQTIRDGAAEAVLASTEHRAAIEQAKGALMLSFGIGEDAAFEMLRTYSNQHNTKLVRVAEYIIAGLADPAFAREEPVRCLLDILLSLESAAAQESLNSA